MPVPPATSAALLDLIRKSGIQSDGRLADLVPDPAALPPEAHRAAGVLVRRGVITRFQGQQLLQGRHKGFLLGSHVVLDLLGRGGMGAVYLAEHRDLHRKVALKVMVPARNEDQRLVTERFLREARAAAALDHPNIVRIFDVARHNGGPFLVMEYVEGETLQQTLDRDGPVPPSTAADMVAQAAAGLQHAHERGFVHRDIKPANLIRDHSGTVKILDMGLARSFADPEHQLTENLDAGAVVGTADFIAPEQALNVPKIDIRADVYSLGATFFALVAGRPPFGGNTTQKLLHHQMKDAPWLPDLDPTLPDGLAAVVAKMLAKKPGDRFQTPAEVIAALAPWLGNSARVLAGLSRTNLAHASGIHASLHDLATGGSSGRLTFAAGGTLPDADEIDHSPGSPETGAVASSETARTPPKPKSPRPPARAKGRKRRALVIAAAGAALLAAGALLGRLAFGG